MLILILASAAVAVPFVFAVMLLKWPTLLRSCLAFTWGFSYLVELGEWRSLPESQGAPEMESVACAVGTPIAALPRPTIASDVIQGLKGQGMPIQEAKARVTKALQDILPLTGDSFASLWRAALAVQL
jgi:hypothetical protein